MRKIYKTNSNGGLAASIPKQMKAAGYVGGALIEWEASNGGFILKLAKPKEEVKTVEPISPTA